MKRIAPILMLALVLLSLGVMSGPSAALTGSWQMITKDGHGNVTTQFASDSIVNVTVLPPSNLPSGGTRSLIVWSNTQNKEITRYSLGYYPSGTNQSSIPKVITINLAAFSQLVNGDTLLLQVRSPVETVEYTSAISVAVNIPALLEQQRQYFFGLYSQQRDMIALVQYQMQSMFDNAMRYIAVMAFVIAFMVAYVTKDIWYRKKKLDEQKQSETEFEQFLETLVLERYTPGDVKGDK